MTLTVCHWVCLEFDISKDSTKASAFPFASKKDLRSASQGEKGNSAQPSKTQGAAGDSPRVGECHDWLMVRSLALFSVKLEFESVSPWVGRVRLRQAQLLEALSAFRWEQSAEASNCREEARL